jgi:penicillin amidase
VWDDKAGIAYSARWTALEDDRIGLGGILGMERSRTAAELDRRAATLVTPCPQSHGRRRRRWHAPDRACGLLPIRPTPLGPGPVPSDGRHEWTGFVPTADMPHWSVPATGFAVNANNRPVGAPWPWDSPRYDWAHDRARRIAQRLSGDASVTLADMMSVQNDVVSLAADRHVRHLLECADSLAPVLPARSRAALDTLRAWDLVVRRDRVAPTLYRAWFGALQRRLGTEGLPGLTLATLMDRAPEVLAHSGPQGTRETPAVAAVASLATALDTLTARLGPDMGSWRYGRAHQARFRHLLSALDPRTRWETPRSRWMATTPHRASAPHDCRGAPRSVSDQCSAMSPISPTAGAIVGRDPAVEQRGLPAEGTLALQTPWRRHGYVPFLLDRARIEQQAHDRTTLTP